MLKKRAIIEMKYGERLDQNLFFRIAIKIPLGPNYIILVKGGIYEKKGISNPVYFAGFCLWLGSGDAWK